MEYALYKGEELLSIGTMEEIAIEVGVEVGTVYFYGTKSYKKRIKGSKNAKILIALDN